MGIKTLEVNLFSKGGFDRYSCKQMEKNNFSKYTNSSLLNSLQPVDQIRTY